ncbi:MAG: type II toxin-antitoxin system RelE/ParE family toxin [Pirellulales bacterium]
MNQCIYSPAARRDLLELYEYIAQDRPDAAQRFIEHLEATCQWLAVDREMGERVEGLRQGARMFSYEKYVIFYEIVANDIRVLRIVHGARDFGLLF